MTCPACRGSGTVVKRFLFFFRRVVVCRVCGGTGRAPLERAGLGVRPRRGVWVGTDDDVVSPADLSRPHESPAQPDTAWIAGGGRSGGGGASASWGDTEPLIVDPFASHAAVAGSSVASEPDDATTTSADDSSSGAESSASESSGSDSGTSY